MKQCKVDVVLTDGTEVTNLSFSLDMPDNETPRRVLTTVLQRGVDSARKLRGLGELKLNNGD